MICAFDYVAFENDTFDVCAPTPAPSGGVPMYLWQYAARQREQVRDDEEALLLAWWAMTQNVEN